MDNDKKQTLTVSGLYKRYYITEKNPAKKFFYRPSVRFKDALADVSFEIGNGLYGLLGPNGAGKSTLMNIMTGILKPDKGQVFWNGRPILQCGINYRRILGFMPQQQGLYDGFTGLQFLSYMCALKEVPAKQTQDEILRTAGLVNMTGELSKKLSACSGGMKQRLLLAAALLGSPKLLILDEPTAGLDPKERVRLRETLSAMTEDKIILLATHVVSDIESVADQVLLLKSGKLEDIGTTTELIGKYAPGQNLESVYLNVFKEEGAS